jgi:NAD-dependent deacetylase
VTGLRSDRRIVVLTGAGVSAESGIPTFRDAGGVWEEHSLEDVATPEGFARDPVRAWRFYNDRRRDLRSVEPNEGHLALAALESIVTAPFLLVTQNVDDLHERAGSTRILHMHGELNKVRCLACGRVSTELSDLPDTPLCQDCGGPLRPHVVWFGEVPFHMGEILEAVATCDWFLAVGTSGTVHPASELLRLAAARGARTMVVNPDPRARTSLADVFIEEPSGTALPRLVAEIALRALPRPTP